MESSALLQSKETSPSAFLSSEHSRSLDTRGGAKKAAAVAAVGPSPKDKRIATITYFADIFFGGTTLIFLVLWVRSLLAFKKPDYIDGFPNFNKMVLKQGFCNAIDPKPWPPTQVLCGIVDLILVVGSYFLLGDAIKTPEGGLKRFYIAAIVYTLIHGATHYSVHAMPGIASGPLWVPGNLQLSISGIVLMSVVMIFAPYILYSLLSNLKIENAVAIAGGFWVAIIAFFAIFLQQKEFALTYINVTIFLTMYGLRPLLIGKDKDEDIKIRVGMSPSSIPLFLVTTTVAIGVMCMEPLVCKAWFESVGGHVWFDIALFAMLLTSFS